MRRPDEIVSPDAKSVRVVTRGGYIKPGAETLLEYRFEPLHEAMREARLDYQRQQSLGLTCQT